MAVLGATAELRVQIDRPALARVVGVRGGGGAGGTALGAGAHSGDRVGRAHARERVAANEAAVSPGALATVTARLILGAEVTDGQDAGWALIERLGLEDRVEPLYHKQTDETNAGTEAIPE